MVCCCAIGCANRHAGSENGKEISLHLFPNDPIIRSKWIAAVKRKDWVPSKRSVICSSHFRTDDFLNYAFKKKLKPEAVPSIFPSFPSYYQRKANKRKPPKERDGVTLENQTAEIDSHASPPLASNKFEDVTPEAQSCPRPSVSMDITKNQILRKLWESRRQLKLERQRNLRLKKKVVSLEATLKNLREQNLMGHELESYVTTIPSISKELITRQIKKTEKKKVSKKYPTNLRAFALTLNYYSPKAYEYVRKTFSGCLPHNRTISRWYASVDCSPGFCVESKKALELKCQNADHKIVCALVFDEMSVRKHIEFDGKKLWGYVDYGTELDNDSLPVANEALVLMLVAINQNWKLPMAYFMSNGLSGEQKAAIVSKFLIWASVENMQVVSLTCDGTSANISMAKHLGCELHNSLNLKPNFKHPVTHQLVHFFLDPCHMLKLVRNTFGDKKVLQDNEGNKICWGYIETLVELQEKEGLTLANKLTQAHLKWRSQTMKVKLAVQLMSDSVADSLKFCEVSKLPGFENCGPTINFLKKFNQLFDILNSRNIYLRGFKQAINLKNVDTIRQFLLDMQMYINALKTENGALLCTSSRKTGFLGFLVCVSSVLNMYKDLIEEQHILKYLPTYKISQDHLELLFGVIRSKFGCNNNPTVRQFQSAFKSLVIHTELQAGSKGNSIPLESLPILSYDSMKKPVVLLNNSDPRLKIVNTVQEEDDHTYAALPGMSDLSAYKSEVIKYIAGFIVKSLEKIIKCVSCVCCLRGMHHALLIDTKNKGGLIYPSEDVYKVCKTTEQELRFYLLKHGLRRVVNMTPHITTSVLHKFIGTDIFKGTWEHSGDYGEDNHTGLLIKSVSEKYLTIRLFHEAKNQRNLLHTNYLRSTLKRHIILSGQ